MAPLADINGYKALWHPYDGHNLPYRLLYPYNYNPEQSYPLLVFTGGSGEVGTDNISHLSWSIATAFHSGTSAYQTWPCFVLCPQCPATPIYDGPETYSQELEFHPYGGVYAAQYWSWYIAAVLDLIENIQQAGFVFYNESDLSGTDETLSACNIDTNKIFHMGASLGGLACYAIALEGRDVWAALVPCKAFNIASAYTDYYRPESGEYNAEYALRHKREYERIYHIPQLLIDYQGDGMYNVMQGMHYVQKELLTEVYGAGSPSIASKLLFVSIDGGEGSESYFHGLQGDFNSIFNPANLIDITNPDEQEYGESGADTNPMNWLFAQTKPTCHPDPYPEGGFTYFPERCYAVVSNASPSNSIYNGQLEKIVCDVNKEVRVRVAGNETVVEFTDGLYIHTQDGVNCFRLRDRGHAGQIDKLSMRQHYIGV